MYIMDISEIIKSTFSRAVLLASTFTKDSQNLHSRTSYILIIDFSEISRSTFSQSGSFGFRLLPKFLTFAQQKILYYIYH